MYRGDNNKKDDIKVRKHKTGTNDSDTFTFGTQNMCDKTSET